MRIGIDARMYGPKISGIGNYVKNLIDNLLQIDNENEYVIFMLCDGFEEFHAPKDKKVKKILVKSRWYSWPEQLYLWRQMEKERTDIMHFPNFNVPLLFTRKFIVTIHDMTPWSFPGFNVLKSEFRRFAYAAVFNSAVKRAERIITVSNFSKGEIIKKYGNSAKKIEVVYNGIGSHFFSRANYGIIHTLKERYGIQKPYIFYIGVWREHKNIPGLLHAFKILIEKYKVDMQLVLAGDVSRMGNIIDKEIQELGLANKVIKTGFLQDNELPAMYHGSQLTVIPSFIEGFGLHGIESMVCGTPVVGSRTTSLPEVLGDSAIYFDPYDHEDMAQAMEQVLCSTNLRTQLLEKGARMVKKYSWATCAAKTLEIYSSSFYGKNTKETV